MSTDTQHANYGDHSALLNALKQVTTQLQAWLAASVLVRTGNAVTSALATATDSSALANGARTLAQYTRQSFLYRWLTKEPDPNVIVIDLRETYTIGPLIALLDRLAPVVDRTWRGSRIYRVTEALRTSPKLEWVANSRTVQLLVAALEPPEPPEEARDGPSSRDGR